jgi:hypothetical protein
MRVDVSAALAKTMFEIAAREKLDVQASREFPEASKQHIQEITLGKVVNMLVRRHGKVAP